MKKLIALVLLAGSVSAMAQYPHHNHRHGGWGYNGWIAPVIVSGVVGYEIARHQTPPVIIQQPVIVQPAPVTQYYGQTQTQTCTAWTEIRNSDGTVTVTRTCSQ
jgi:hypothetical protein